MKRDSKDKDMVKSRLIVLSKMFYTRTDENHMMTNLQILDYLKEHNVPANEKTLRGDIRLLKELGFDIVTIVSRPNRYYQRSREFTLPELKLLIDAVSASRFITRKKSHDLGLKLAELASEHQKPELRRNVYATNRAKNSNEYAVRHNLARIQNLDTTLGQFKERNQRNNTDHERQHQR